MCTDASFHYTGCKFDSFFPVPAITFAQPKIFAGKPAFLVQGYRRNDVFRVFSKHLNLLIFKTNSYE
ncbi:MAG: hypothetical protein DYG98_09145 [Haliscomenobacteraceae bacterium CHB4]|nr:hypothetical protein [Haliscomenobacteraceae bacterium CHB4]